MTVNELKKKMLSNNFVLTIEVFSKFTQVLKRKDDLGNTKCPLTMSTYIAFILGEKKVRPFLEVKFLKNAFISDNNKMNKNNLNTCFCLFQTRKRMNKIKRTTTKRDCKKKGNDLILFFK